MKWYENELNFPCLIMDTTNCYAVCDYINDAGKLCNDEGNLLYTADPEHATFIAPITVIIKSLHITNPELFL